MLNNGYCVVLMLLVLVAAPSDSFSQSWRNQVDRQIAASDLLATLRTSGYGESHDVRYGTLRPGQDTSIALPIGAGQRYAFVGLCDDDCGDLDLHLYDSSGALVRRDIADDDVPVVTGQRSEGGTYLIRIVMASCRASFCGWALVTPRQRHTTNHVGDRLAAVPRHPGPPIGAPAAVAQVASLAAPRARAR